MFLAFYPLTNPFILYESEPSRSGRLTLIYFKFVLIMTINTLFLPPVSKETLDLDYGSLAINVFLGLIAGLPIAILKALLK